MSFKVRKVDAQPARIKKSWQSILASIIAISRPLLGLYRSWKKERTEIETNQSRLLLLKKTLIILVAVLFTVLVGAGVVKTFVYLQALNIQFFSGVSSKPPPVDKSGLTNILLLGQGDANHDGTELTDTLIVASIDQKNEIAVMLSLPRDIQVSTDFFGEESVLSGRRLNSLFRDIKLKILGREKITEKEAAVKALGETKKEIGNLLKIDIQHAVMVDFTGFTDAVDILGGVEIDVPYDIIDTTYPNDKTRGFQTFKILKGKREIDGDTALKYARSRHTTSDFSRSARQQQLIKAMVAKAEAIGLVRRPTKMLQLWNTFSKKVKTTMSLDELMGLAQIGRNFNRFTVVTFQLSDSNGLYDVPLEPAGLLYAPPREEFDGASVLLPVSIPQFPVTWKQIKAFCELIFRERWLYKSPPVIHILNAGAPSGSARSLYRELHKYGIPIEDVSNSSLEEDLPTTFIIQKNPDSNKYSKYMSELFGYNLTEDLLDLTEDEVGDVTFVLGEDFELTLLQDLITLSK